MLKQRRTEPLICVIVQTNNHQTHIPHRAKARQITVVQDTFTVDRRIRAVTMGLIKDNKIHNLTRAGLTQIQNQIIITEFIKQNKIKKIILFLFALVITAGAYSQSYTQKYNSLYDRTDFFDSNGSLIGYAKENTLYNRLEYYDANGNLLKYEKHNDLYNRNETYDQNGNQQGNEKKNDLYNRTDKYDQNGNQQGYKKWNDLYKRYDVYDGNNNLIGHYKWNDLYQRWDYDSNPY